VLFFPQLFSVGRGVCGGCGFCPGFCYGSTCNLFVICERGHEVRVRVWPGGVVPGVVDSGRSGCWRCWLLVLARGFWFLVPVPRPVLVLWLLVGSRVVAVAVVVGCPVLCVVCCVLCVVCCVLCVVCCVLCVVCCVLCALLCVVCCPVQ
jgi:hypothetical protein